jgi:hypothetical protein
MIDLETKIFLKLFSQLFIFEIWSISLTLHYYIGEYDTWLRTSRSTPDATR